MKTLAQAQADRERLLAVFYNPDVQPEGYVAIRCTLHGRFIVWCSPPAPPCDVACPPTCSAERAQPPGPALHHLG